MKRIVLALILLILFVSKSPRVVFAQEQVKCEDLPKSEWVEENTKYFALLFVPSQIEQIPSFNSWKSSIDLEYERFQTLFQAELNLPITVQFYPTAFDFSCTNPITDPLVPGQSHTSIGQREISFVIEYIDSDPLLSSISMLNNFRYELAGLFVSQITDNKAPAGLVYGMKLYAVDPAYIHTLPGGDPLPVNDTPAQSWRYIWENQDTATNKTLQLNAVSIVAYLGDAYGWDKLNMLTKAIPTSQNYREALLETYKVDPDTLEEQWMIYYPSYFSGRWRSHAIYGLDLSGIETLIRSGAYIDGAELIKEIMPSLESAGQQANIQKARTLLELARQGEEAGNMVKETRSALQSGDYQRCILLAEQAIERYQSLGDLHRIPELEAYRERAEEILSLRLVAKELAPKASIDLESALQIREIGNKLASYDDEEGLAVAQSALNNYVELQKESKTRSSLRTVLIILILLSIRVIMLLLDRRRPEVL